MITEQRLNRLLLIEDSPATRMFIRTALQNVYPNLEFLEADNGYEALKMLPNAQVDLIITDINMPDINGLELISFLKNHPNYKNLPVIIVTTEGHDDDRKKGLSLGAEAYIVKPFEPEVLVRVIEKLRQNIGMKPQNPS